MSATLRARNAAVLPLLIVFVLVAGLVSVATPAADAATRHQKALRGLDITRNQKGDPYRWGAEGPTRFDCSGLVYFAFRKAGFTNVPRTSDQQARFADRIKRRNMHKGDLVFFHDGGGVYHVGIFAGWNKRDRKVIIHAPYGGRKVHRSVIWGDNWFPATLR
jgi:cell wall-associated NlpC family hydrolase